MHEMRERNTKRGGCDNQSVKPARGGLDGWCRLCVETDPAECEGCTVPKPTKFKEK